MNVASRLRKLQDGLDRNGLDAVLYGLGANFQYFTGLQIRWKRMEEPDEPGCLLLVARGQEPQVMLHVSYAGLAAACDLSVDFFGSRAELPGMLRRSLRGRRVGTSRAAAGYLQELVGEARRGAACVDAERLGEEIRVQKDEDEVALLRRVVALTDRVMEKVVGEIRPGVTQNELQALIRKTGLDLGAQDVSFEPAALFVKSGGDPTPDPFVYPKDQGLVPGTSVAFDFGFVAGGYCSDFGRSFYCGPAPAHIAGAYRALHEAQCELVGRMKPGRMKLNEMFGVLEAAMDRLGYGDRLRARLKDGTLGHQIGVDLHENPWIRPDSDVPLQPGMVMAIEPKAWFPGEYYLRVEDVVLVGEEGAAFLTGSSREVFELPG